jgi:hypothetical protein
MSVDPKHHRRGAGSLLMEYGLGLVDKLGVDVSRVQPRGMSVWLMIKTTNCLVQTGCRGGFTYGAVSVSELRLPNLGGCYHTKSPKAGRAARAVHSLDETVCKDHHVMTVL